MPALPATNSGSPYFAYTPIDGERDIAGFLRQDDPNKATVGSGSRPFFDIGAYEYRQLFPPDVTMVRAVVQDATTGALQAQNLYQAGGVSGTNQSPLSILVNFNQKIDPATLNSLTVLLEASGGDGIFGNANNSQDRFIPLSGKLAYDPNTSTLTIYLGTLGLNLSNDLYRIIILGSGSNVVRNPQGLALDGENTVGGSANGAQLPLPSGDGNPGGDFYATFSIDTHPPAIVPSTFQLAADSDNYPNDNITNNPLPTFTGTITDIAPPANPVAGQTVAIDISTKGNGVYDIMNAGVGTTDAQGNFTITLTKPLPNSIVNVGPDGILGTADDVLSSYSLARVRITDQSGNVSSLTDPNALYRFDEDQAAPVITGVAPANGAVVTPANNQVNVSVAINENIDPKTLNTNNITVMRSGGDGIFGNGNDVQLLVDPTSISEQYLGNAAGGVILHFTIQGVSVNDSYQVTLNGAAGGLADLAGNTLNGGSYTLKFLVLNNANSHTIFVGPNAAATAGTTTPDGSRANPYPTITGGLAVANIGDTVAVLSGTTSANVYTESINLKSLVRVVSANPSSTDGHVVPGDPLKTVIRAPYNAGQSTITVSAVNVYGEPSFPAEISGFTIASPLSSGGATGSITDWSVGVYVNNSSVQIDRNYLIDNFAGITVDYNYNQVLTPMITDNGIIGNVHGVVVFDNGVSQYTNAQPTRVINNTIANNTYGLSLSTDASGPTDVAVLNNIFWQNVSRTSPDTGAAIKSTNPGRISVGNNLFSANGPSVNSPADDTINVGGDFNPALLGPTHDAHGNITGNPAFVLPIDPRPEANGPGTFFLGANYDLTSSSAAIDNAINAVAPSTDLLYRSRVNIPLKGFAGPADMGAFEYKGTGGITSTTSSTLTSVPAVTYAATRSVATGAGVSSASATANSVKVTFASPVNRSTVQATDLLISGDGLDAANPAHATSLTWVDNQTVQFNLSGGFRPTGTVTLDIPTGAVLNSNNTAVPEFTTQTPSPLTPTNSGSASTGTNSTPTNNGSTNPPASTTPVNTTSPVTFTPVTTPVLTPAPSPTPTPTPANSRIAALIAARQARQQAQLARQQRQAQLAAARQQSGFLSRLGRFGRKG